jgi:hypothetical protein
MNLARLLVVGEAVGDEVRTVVSSASEGVKPSRKDDKGAGNFSGGEVGFGDHAAIAHGGMFEQDGFDFGGRDRESLCT